MTTTSQSSSSGGSSSGSISGSSSSSKQQQWSSESIPIVPVVYKYYYYCHIMCCRSMLLRYRQPDQPGQLLASYHLVGTCSTSIVVKKLRGLMRESRLALCMQPFMSLRVLISQRQGDEVVVAIHRLAR